MEDSIKNIDYKIRIKVISPKIKRNSIIYGGGFLLLFFQVAIAFMEVSGAISAIFHHYDEALAVLLTVYVLCHIKFLLREKGQLVAVHMCLLAIGFISSIIYQYQSLTVVLIDAVILVSRFLTAYYAAYIFLKIHKINISGYILGLAKLLTVFLFVLSLHEIFFTPFFPAGDYRYFMNGLQLMFPHCTYFAASASVLLVYFGYMHRKQKGLFLYMVLASLLVIFTLRAKATGFVVVYWCFYFQTFYFKKRHYILMGLISLIPMLFVAQDSIMGHYGEETHFMPRLIMTRDGINLMFSYFPLGTGFGTYGSAMAAANYSPVYEKLGYMAYKGMRPDDASFLCDVFWPEIFVQFGLIGTALFILIVVMFIKLGLKLLKRDKSNGFAILMLIVYNLINSTSDTAFFNPSALMMFLLIGVFEVEKEARGKMIR